MDIKENNLYEPEIFVAPLGTSQSSMPPAVQPDYISKRWPLSNSTQRRKNSCKRFSKIVVWVPPGTLGIHLRDREDGTRGTFVAGVEETSPLVGMVFEGDQIISINGIGVSAMGAEIIGQVCTQQISISKEMEFIRPAHQPKKSRDRKHPTEVHKKKHRTKKHNSKEHGSSNIIHEERIWEKSTDESTNSQKETNTRTPIDGVESYDPAHTRNQCQDSTIAPESKIKPNRNQSAGKTQLPAPTRQTRKTRNSNVFRPFGNIFVFSRILRFLGIRTRDGIRSH